MRGQWECIWGERDGHPLAKGDEYRINVHDDRPTEFTLEGRSGTGYLFMNYAGPRKRIWSPSSDKTAPQTMIRGICEVTADRLKLCVFDESRKEVADSDWVDSHYPTKFEGKKDSCHIYYEFKRKTPGPPKK